MKSNIELDCRRVQYSTVYVEIKDHYIDDLISLTKAEDMLVYMDNSFTEIMSVFRTNGIYDSLYN